MPLRMCPRRRLISQSPRYLLTWQCRRSSTASTSHLWMLLCRRSHTVLLSQDVSTQMGARPASSFSIGMFVQTPIRSTVLHDVATQLPITEFFIGCIFSNDPFDRQGSSSRKAILVVPHRLNLLTLLQLAVSAIPALTETVTSALCPHVSCCSHHRVSNSMPCLQVSLLMPTCALHMVYLLKRHRCDPVHVQLFQSLLHSLLFVPSMWEHTLCAQLLPAREVRVPPLLEPTILSIQILVQDLHFS